VFKKTSPVQSFRNAEMASNVSRISAERIGADPPRNSG
jgi:hypothetical protein